MSTGIPVSTILLFTGFALAVIGIIGILTHRNIMRMIIGFALLDTGIHIVMVASGYVTGATAPIVEALPADGTTPFVVDPVPSALAVTAIVIGFSVTAVMLAFAVRLHASKKSLDIGAFTESRW
ncbi:sodium:proton antiporter [Acuticoccus kandeliae]|uniref:sodium:proton antiporter n=1 Tax=Acuticoccus kandeliae TaxID=2073160 RepID=UPI000D3E3E3C|nr:sodium:proton antiporter [Acuticoccus kandeliae]